MKKIVLSMVSLMVIALFLIGCAPAGETGEDLEVVDEEGNIIGEAFRMSGRQVVVKSVSSGASGSSVSDLEKRISNLESRATSAEAGIFQTSIIMGAIAKDLGSSPDIRAGVDDFFGAYSSAFTTAEAPTDPFGEDTDGDGFYDSTETNSGSDPNDSESTPVDRDGDGYPAWNDADDNDASVHIISYPRNKGSYIVGNFK